VFAATVTIESSDPVGGPIGIALNANSTKDPKEIKDKENKDSKDTKDEPDKIRKDNKDNKDNKDTKDTPDNKNTKDTKENNNSKDRKDAKDEKHESKREDKEFALRDKVQGNPNRHIPAPSPGNRPGMFLVPVPVEDQPNQPTGHAFIRPDERPELGGSALNEPLERRTGKRRRLVPLVPPSGSQTGPGDSGGIQ